MFKSSWEGSVTSACCCFCRKCWKPLAPCFLSLFFFPFVPLPFSFMFEGTHRSSHTHRLCLADIKRFQRAISHFFKMLFLSFPSLINLSPLLFLKCFHPRTTACPNDWYLPISGKLFPSWYFLQTLITAGNFWGETSFSLFVFFFALIHNFILDVYSNRSRLGRWNRFICLGWGFFVSVPLPKYSWLD